MNKDKNKDKKKENAPFVWSFGTALLVSGIFALLPCNWQAGFGIILGLSLMIFSGYFFLKKEKADSQS
ncbi:MAG: hypothetical protein J6W21_01125 [Bacteroidaceae bacterium]|nr:hypothetical protein [Bacteroidaceae bacterium]